MADNFETEISKLVAEIRDVTDSKNKESAENKEKLGKMHTRLDELEESNKKMTLEKVESAKKLQELDEALKSAEKSRLRMSQGYKAESEDEDMAIMKAKKEGFVYNVKSSPESVKFWNDAILASNGTDAASNMQAYRAAMAETEIGKKWLRTDSQTDGGFTCPPEYYNEIIKKITETNPMRQIAKIRPTVAFGLYVPTRTVLMSSAWAGESIEATTSNSKYGQEKIFANRLTVNATVTQSLLMNSMFDMQAEIQADAAEEFSRKESEAFISGTGAEEPTGIMNDPNIKTWNSGIAADIDFDPLIQLTGQIKTGYNPLFIMNRRTRAALVTKKAANGQYLWTAGNVAAGQPNAIAGFPYLDGFISLDDIGANKYPIFFGDFGRGYMICDRMLMMVTRDDYTQAKKAEINFVFHRYVGGGTVLPESIGKLKCSTDANTNF